MQSHAIEIDTINQQSLAKVRHIRVYSPYQLALLKALSQVIKGIDWESEEPLREHLEYLLETIIDPTLNNLLLRKSLESAIYQDIKQRWFFQRWLFPDKLLKVLNKVNGRPEFCSPSLENLDIIHEQNCQLIKTVDNTLSQSRERELMLQLENCKLTHDLERMKVKNEELKFSAQEVSALREEVEGLKVQLADIKPHAEGSAVNQLLKNCKTLIANKNEALEKRDQQTNVLNQELKASHQINEQLVAELAASKKQSDQTLCVMRMMLRQLNDLQNSKKQYEESIKKYEPGLFLGIN